MHTYFQPSGNVDAGKATGLTIGAMAIIVLLSFVYTAINAYNPIVYLSFLAAFGYGYALYFMVTYIMEQAKFRSMAKAFGLAVLLGLWANYTQWIGFLDYIMNGAELSISSYLSSLGQPLEMFSMVPIINEMGTWGLSDSTVSGGFLTVVWVIEFAFILLAPVYFLWGTSIRPFSENKDRFYDDFVVKELFAHFPSYGLVEKELLKDPVNYLKSIDPTNTIPGSMIQLFTLAGEDQSYLSVLEVTQDEKENIVTKPKINYLRISNADAQELKSYYSQVRDTVVRDVEVED